MKKLLKKHISVLLLLILSISLLTCSMALPTSAQESTNNSNSVDTESILYGKTALFCGDSICAASVRDTTRQGWPGRIALHYGMTSTNKGQDGASISNCRPEYRIISQINAVKNNEYDYVILHGGVNDAMDIAPVGTKSESFEVADFKINTFAGGLEELFYYAKEYFGEDTQYGYIINFQTPKSGWGGATKNMTKYVEVAIQICDKWDIPYLDLYNDEDFNTNKMKVDTNENLNEFTQGTQIDMLHPNTSGYEVLYPVIGDWMETLGVETVSEVSVESEAVSMTTSTASEDDDNDSKKALPWIFGGVAVTFALVAIAYILLAKKNKK